jgi:hypothetical protein
MTRQFLCVALTGVILSFAASTYAQTPPLGSCTFLGVKQTDRVGPGGATPDGKPDAVFALDLTPPPGATPVTDIEITASDPPGSWSSAALYPAAGFIGVALAKSPTKVINSRGGAMSLNPSKAGHVLLFITDDGNFSRKSRRCVLRVIHKDGRSWTAAVKNEAVEPAAPPPGAGPGVPPVRMTAVLKGISNFDAVNPSKKLGGDEKGDGLFVLTVEARDREITAIEIRNTDGTRSVWDTVAGSSNHAIGVALVSEPAKLLNKPTGTVHVKVRQRADLNLYVADNGSIAAGKTSYRVTVTFADGGISWCPVTRSAAPAAAAGKPESGPKVPFDPGARVNFLGTWLGFVTTDAVGKYPELKPDGAADAVFGLDIEVSPKHYITGIEINSLDNSTPRWATTGVGSGTWGLAVAYQTAPSALLNKPDGSVKIPVENRIQFYLYVADPGNLAAVTHRLRIIVYFADGSSYQQFVRRPPATTSTVAPGSDETTRAKGTLTCEFRGFFADLVNTTTRPGKDGYLDGSFIMKLQVEDKKLARVEIKTEDGKVRWSSNPKAPTMFLGVALYPAIYKLVNPKAGVMHLAVTGRKTIYLYAADNGLLSDPKSRLYVAVTFSDKTTLTTEVIK